MFERRLVLSLSSILLLTLFGCSSERPTKSVVAKIPATPLSSQIVTDSSATVAGMTTSDGVYEFDFSGLPELEAGSYNDISFSFTLDFMQLPEHVEVFDHPKATWRVVDGAAVASGVYLCQMLCLVDVHRLASEVGAVDHLISQDGKLVARSAVRAWYTNPTARLVKFATDYYAVEVLPTPTFQYEYLAFQDGTLYLTSDHYVAGGADAVFDSVVALDVSGERIWATGFDTPGAYQGIFDGQAFWQLREIDGPLVRVDSSGQEIARIDWPFGYVRRMAWANGSLWFVHSQWTAEGVPVVEVDIDSSLAVGSIVSTTRFSLPQMAVDAMTPDASGFIFISGNRISRYTYNGTFRSQQLAPVPAIRAAAWDGESLWVLHHGPTIAYTDASLLSRFELD